MANFQNPNDPQRHTQDDADMSVRARLDRELHADRELQDVRPSGRHMWAYGAALLVILGGVFYGFHSTSINPTEPSKTASQPLTTQDSAPRSNARTNNTADSNTKPPVAPGVRDVTPTRDNSGVTTGSAPIRSQGTTSAPPGTEIDSGKSGSAN